MTHDAVPRVYTDGMHRRLHNNQLRDSIPVELGSLRNLSWLYETLIHIVSILKEDNQWSCSTWWRDLDSLKPCTGGCMKPIERFHSERVESLDSVIHLVRCCCWKYCKILLLHVPAI